MRRGSHRETGAVCPGAFVHAGVQALQAHDVGDAHRDRCDGGAFRGAANAWIWREPAQAVGRSFFSDLGSLSGRRACRVTRVGGLLPSRFSCRAPTAAPEEHDRIEPSGERALILVFNVPQNARHAFGVNSFGESHGPAIGCVVDVDRLALAPVATSSMDLDRRRLAVAHVTRPRIRYGRDTVGRVRRTARDRRSRS